MCRHQPRRRQPTAASRTGSGAWQWRLARGAMQNMHVGGGFVTMPDQGVERDFGLLSEWDAVTLA